MDIKKTVLWLLVILAAGLTVAAVTAVITGFTPGNPIPKLNAVGFTGTVDQEKVFPANDIGKVRVKTVSPDINIIASEGKQVRAHLHGETVSTVSGQPVKLEAQLKGDTLMIEAKPRPNVSINRNTVAVDVYVPSGFGGDINLETTSGTIKLSDFSLNRLYAKSISGDIGVLSVDTAATSVKTTSGDIQVSGFSGDLDFYSISGSLDAAFSEFSSDVTGKTVSGSLTLRLPDGAAFELDSDTVSGRIDCDFPVTVTGTQPKRGLKGTVGNGSSSIDIQTVSGNISIQRR